MLTTPFHEINLKAGAKMVELFGYYLPWEYSVGHEGEHLGTRQGVSLCDLHYMGNFLFEGPDALAFLQTVMTNDYSRKSVGSIQYTAMCGPDGNMVDDGTVWRLGDTKYMFVSGAEDDFSWLKQNVGRHDVKLENITSEHTTLALQGPKSGLVLRKLTPFNLETIRYYRFVETQVVGVDCIVARMGYTGEFGYELIFTHDTRRRSGPLLCRQGLTWTWSPVGRPRSKAYVRKLAISWWGTTTTEAQIHLRPALASP